MVCSYCSWKFTLIASVDQMNLLVVCFMAEILCNRSSHSVALNSQPTAIQSTEFAVDFYAVQFLSNLQKGKFCTRKFWGISCNLPKLSPSKIMYCTVVKSECTNIINMYNCQMFYIMVKFIKTFLHHNFTNTEHDKIYRDKILVDELHVYVVTTDY